VALQAIGLSLLTATISTVATLIFGLPVAYLLSHRPVGKYRLLDTLVDMPMVLPPSVAGIALLVAFGHPAEELPAHGKQDRFDNTKVHYGKWGNLKLD
jgi:ABC-type sulfate transport system permease component